MFLSEQDNIQSRWAPWVSILYSPKTAWNNILERNPYSDYMFWLVTIISGLVVTSLQCMNPILAEFTVSQGFLFSIIMVILLFITDLLVILVSTVVLGALAKWVGNWAGGSGNHKKMQAVLIWAGLPFVYFTALWGIAMLIGGKPIIEAYTLYGYGKNAVTTYLIMLWLGIVVGFGYAEAHGLSVKKGMVLSGITYIIPMLILFALA